MRTRLALLVAVASSLSAQESKLPTLQFEVASIRKHPPSSNDQIQGTQYPDGRMTGEFLTLGDLIQSAFEISRDEIIGGPKWMDSERFDISAKAAAGRTYAEEDFHQMLRALLVDRFSLSFHHETRDTSVYALILGKNGSKLKESADGTKSAAIIRRGFIQLTRVTPGVLPVILPQFVGQPVIDLTGLPEKYYDFKLEWGQDLVSTGEISSGPSIFTAIEEQLGLKLESRRAPRALLIIDQTSLPSDN